MSGSSRSLRVCQFLQGLALGGLERVVVDLCLGLDRCRFEPAVVCYDEEGEMADQLRSAGVPVVLERRRPGLDWDYIRRLVGCLRRLRIEVLHAHNSTAFFYGVPAARLAGVRRVVYTEHGRFVPPRPMLARVHRALAKATDVICAVSDDVRQRLTRFDGIDPQRVRVVFNGVDGSRFRPSGDPGEVRAALGLSHRPTLGIIGRLSPEKDHVLAFRALRLVVERVPEVLLLVVGDGPLRGELPGEAERAGVADHVRFLGARDDVPRIMAALDLLVLSSRTEGLPMVVIEAMAAGRPVVATNVGGCREAVLHGETGLLVPPGNAEELARAVVQLLRKPELRARMGAAGRERFQRLFSLQTMVRNYQEAYLGR